MSAMHSIPPLVTTSSAKAAGCGNPPVMDSTPGGLPARMVAISPLARRLTRRANSGIDPEGQRAGLAAVQRRHVLGVVRQVVQRLAPCLRREDGALGAGDPLGRVEGGRDP